jgi:hypothetical protein
MTIGWNKPQNIKKFKQYDNVHYTYVCAKWVDGGRDKKREGN